MSGPGEIGAVHHTRTGRLDTTYVSACNRPHTRRIFNGIRNLGSDNHLNAILVVAGEIASEIDADKNFESIPRHRVRQRG
ncbi:hypothetical protein AVEN_13969-1 [Araneus ventricosus]|uniref:Uncharacterized protein n=1 Tax=Araneus ventricosus TaxID=182803 RepID=A0A4Y2K3U9_ARAVE|nr:hypothetical protein AVEN_13969-1 [Araneus ventricosus]